MFRACNNFPLGGKFGVRGFGALATSLPPFLVQLFISRMETMPKHKNIL